MPGKTGRLIIFSARGRAIVPYERLGFEISNYDAGYAFALRIAAGRLGTVLAGLPRRAHLIRVGAKDAAVAREWLEQR